MGRNYPDSILDIQVDDEEFYNPNLYTPNLEWDGFDVIDYKKRDLSFKNVMKIMALSNDGRYDLCLLDCESLDEYRALVQWLFKARWRAESNIYEQLTDDERKKLSKSEQVFDYLLDYDAYWCDFFSIGIDLEKDEMDFIRFCWVLENKFMTDEKSAIANRIRMRSYKPQKGESNDYKNNANKLKAKYSLHSIDDQKLYESLNEFKQGGVTIGGN